MKSVPEDLKDVLNQHDFGLNYINTVRAKRGAVKLLKALKDPSTKAKYVQNQLNDIGELVRTQQIALARIEEVQLSYGEKIAQTLEAAETTN